MVRGQHAALRSQVQLPHNASTCIPIKTYKKAYTRSWTMNICSNIPLYKANSTRGFNNKKITLAYAIYRQARETLVKSVKYQFATIFC